MAGGTFEQLNRVLDDLANVDLSTMGRLELASHIIEVDTMSRRVDGHRAMAMAEADRAGVAANAGLRNMGQYVASRTHCDPADVRADVLLGRWLGDLTVLGDAFVDGRISRRHLSELRKVDNIRVHQAMIRDQDLFVGFVETLEWNEYLNAVGYWLLANDPDGAEPKDPTDKNRLTVKTRADGRVTGSFDMDPISGAVFKQQLGAAEKRLFASDAETGVKRSGGQRRIEALLTIFALASGNTTGTTAQPLVHIVMSKTVADETLARLQAEDAADPVPVDYDNVDGRCELIDGTPINPKQALILLAVAEMRRQVLAGKSRTLDLGETTRLFPEYMKTALLVEARGQCLTPGCDAPYTWIQADHIIAASHHGPTATDNSDSQCAGDNGEKAAGPPLGDRKPKPHATTPTSYHYIGPDKRAVE